MATTKARGDFIICGIYVKILTTSSGDASKFSWKLNPGAYQEGSQAGMNFPQKVAVAITDAAVLAELALSIYLANKDLMNFTPLFFKYFLGMLIPTLILAKIVIKRLRTEVPPTEPGEP